MSSTRFHNLFKNSCVDHCCFCVKPKTGCLIIGYLYLVCIVTVLILITVPFYTFKLSPRATQGDANIAYFLMFFWFTIPFLACILYLGFTIALLIGLHQNKSNLVDTFIFFTYMVNVLHLVFLILCYAFGLEIIIILVPDMIYLAISFYFVLVIRSYHAKMNEVETGTAMYSTGTITSDLQHNV